MGNAPPRQIAYGEGRASIVTAVIHLVGRRGFASLTFRSLADEAGVSIGAIRYHFRTVDDAVRAALEETEFEARSNFPVVQSIEELVTLVVTEIREASDQSAFTARLYLEPKPQPWLVDVAEARWEATSAHYRQVLQELGIDQAWVTDVFLTAIAGSFFHYFSLGPERDDFLDRQEAVWRQFLSLNATATPAVRRAGDA